MKYISQAMNRLNLEEGTKTDDMSIVEKIIHKTSDPKIAAVLALDLLLVGVDTVSWPHRDGEHTAANAEI
jgi:cytochrome P450 family 49 subfamily A